MQRVDIVSGKIEEVSLPISDAKFEEISSQDLSRYSDEQIEYALNLMEAYGDPSKLNTETIIKILDNVSSILMT